MADLNLKQVMAVFGVGYQRAVAIVSRAGGKQQKGGWRVTETQLLVYAASKLKDLEAQIEELEATVAVPLHVGSRKRSGIGRSRREFLAGRDGDRCFYCLVSGETLTVDHVIPVSRGGRSRLDNLVLACQRCNAKKKNLLPREAVTAGLFDVSILDRLSDRPYMHGSSKAPSKI